jgi:putative PIN family toxin of toxin-antitoxin system
MVSGIVVCDTSVLIPLILPKSKSSTLYTRLDRAGWIVAATPAILAEVREKLQNKPALRKWLALTDADIADFVDHVLPALVRLYPGIVTATGAVVADPDDDVVVAAALESQAGYIVTEDQNIS